MFSNVLQVLIPKVTSLGVNTFGTIFDQVYEDMPQICVDVPPAYTILEKFVALCQAAKIISDDMAKKIPVR